MMPDIVCKDGKTRNFTDYVKWLVDIAVEEKLKDICNYEYGENGIFPKDATKFVGSKGRLNDR